MGTNPTLSLVTHCCEFHHWSPSLWQPHNDTDDGGSLLKAAHFVPLPKLPIAAETGDLPVQHVFHIHGIWKEIVSDRILHFISQVWRASGWKQVSLRGNILSPTIRWKGPTTPWGTRSDVWQLHIRPPGAPVFRVWSSLISLWSHPLPEFRPLWHCWTTALPCSITRGRRLRSPLFGRTFIAVGSLYLYGSRFALLSFAHPSRQASRHQVPTPIYRPGQVLLGMAVRKGPSAPGRMKENSNSIKWGLSRWIECLTPWRCIWNSLAHSSSTIPSTYHRSSRFWSHNLVYRLNLLFPFELLMG